MLVQRPSWIQIVLICLLGVRATMSSFSTKSLGVDTYEHDPISHFLLESGDFLKVGAAVGPPRCPLVNPLNAALDL